MKVIPRHSWAFTDEHSDAVALRKTLRKRGYDLVGTTTQGGILLQETFFKGKLKVEIDYHYYENPPEREAY